VILVTCKSSLSNSSDFLIKVDSVNVPATITAEIPFDVAFFGLIGDNECLSFKTFNHIVNNNTIIIEAWGTYFDNGVCPTSAVLLNGEKLSLTIPLPGTYILQIREPGNYTLVKQLAVK
jgi:hypothetical protein